MKKSTFSLEKELSRQGFDFVVGVDEAGRGPLCGPVVASAVILKNIEAAIVNQKTEEWDLVRDSKQLSEKQREKIFDFIYENFYVGIGLCDHETIDRINILEASFLAMKKAIADLEKNMRQARNDKDQKNSIIHKLGTKGCVLVDGNKNIPNFSMEQKTVVGGDKIIKSISAASIVAKVIRDRFMMKMHEKYPEYQFNRNKGYGTKVHMDALEKHGPCEIHRKSFAPVKKSLIRPGLYKKAE